jgi:hypothetical protein
MAERSLVTYNRDDFLELDPRYRGENPISPPKPWYSAKLRDEPADRDRGE